MPKFESCLITAAGIDDRINVEIHLENIVGGEMFLVKTTRYGLKVMKNDSLSDLLAYRRLFRFVHESLKEGLSVRPSRIFSITRFLEKMVGND